MSMENQTNPYQSYAYAPVAAAADEWERATFVRRTYAHLAGAVLLFIGLEALAFMLTDQATRQDILRLMIGQRYSWLVVLGLFMVVSWIANSWARSATSLSTQYMGLGLYVVGQAVIFLPLLFLAERFFPGAISSAAIITAIVFGGLTAFVFMTKMDLAGWGKYLGLAGLAAMGFIVFAIIFPTMVGIGPIFITLMIVLACGYILYDTSNVMHHYRTTQHVAAALALFASVALLFWYILQLVMSLSRD